jgi:DNA-3-methyladenine glycosylase
MLNIVAGEEGRPEALLIRGAGDISGPGLVTRYLKLGSDFYGENLTTSNRIWLENAQSINRFSTSPRIGINYAGEPWVSIPWRFRAITAFV